MTAASALGGCPPALQQGEHERREFVPHWNACEPDTMSAPMRLTLKDGVRTEASWSRWPSVIRLDSDAMSRSSSIILARAIAVVERRDDLDRLRQAAEVGLQLLLEVRVEHFNVLKIPSRPAGGGGGEGLESCRPGPATGEGSSRRASTWPGRPRPGARRCTGSLNLAQKFLGVAADTEVVHLGDLDHALGVHDEGAGAAPGPRLRSGRRSCADRVGGVADHRYSIFLIVSDASCQALCVKCVSVDTL